MAAKIMRRSSGFGRFAAVVLALAVSTGAQEVQFTLGQDGLTSLTYGGTEVGIPAENAFCESGLWALQRPDSWKEMGRGVSSVNQAESTVTLTFPWGWASCKYMKKAANRLDMRVIVHNGTGADIIRAFGQFIALAGRDTVTYLAPVCSWIFCADGGATRFNAGGGAQGDLANSANAALFDLRGSNCSAAMALSANAWWDRNQFKSGLGYPGAYLRFNIDTLKVGSSDTVRVSLRFSTAGVSIDKLKSLVPDAFMQQAGAHPSMRYWTDRRPIGVTYISTTSTVCPAPNTAGWFGCRSETPVNTTTPAGLEDFRTRLFAQLDECITNTRRMNGQGIIVWDIEGGRYQRIMYPGDPDMIDSLAPEMNYKGAHEMCIVDEYFKRIRDAGLLPGVCIRPTKVARCADDPNGFCQVDVADPGQEIVDEMDYAYKRWGIRLFYMDSNPIDASMPVDKLYSRIYARHPDVLVAGEWQNTQYYAWGTVYESYHFPPGVTPEFIRCSYPDAFSMIDAGSQWSGGVERYLQSAKNGDIFLNNCWYPDPMIDSTVKVQAMVGKRPQCAMTSPLTDARVPATFAMAATASDSDGTIAKVEFLSAGIVVGSAAAAPYRFTWTDAPAGRHSLCARAIDDKGAMTCSRAVNVTVDPAAPPAATALPARYGQAAARTQGSLVICTPDGRLVKRMHVAGVSGRVFAGAARGFASGVYIIELRQAGAALPRKVLSLGTNGSP